MRCKKIILLSLGFLFVLYATTALANENYWKKIQDRGTINVGILVDWPPYDGADTNGQPQGYDAAVAKMLANYYGLKLHFVVLTGPNRIPYLLTNKVDVVIGSLTVTPGRAKQVQFSRPYSAAIMVLLGHKGMKISGPQDFHKYTIGVPRASSTDIALTKIAPKGYNLKRYASDSSSLQAMLVGQIDAVGTSSIIADRITKKHPKFVTLYKIDTQLMAVALKKNRPKLLNAMNKFISVYLKNGELNKAFEKWIDQPLPKKVYKKSSVTYTINKGE